jgi:RNA polymerase sigma-70 factor (ECF subfamily)
MTIECTPSDTILAERIRARDEAAFELLYVRYEAALTRHAAAIVREETVAQDLVQETFLRVWTRVDQWNGLGSFKSWLYQIATHLAFNHLRSLRRHPHQSLLGEEERPADEWSEAAELFAPNWLVDTTTLGPDAAYEQSEAQSRLRRVIAGLPAEKQEVFHLVHEMELSIRDTASRLGIPEGTVKSRLHYAEKGFNAAWQNQIHESEE